MWTPDGKHRDAPLSGDEGKLWTGEAGESALRHQRGTGRAPGTSPHPLPFDGAHPDAEIASMTTSPADVRSQRSEYVEEVVKTHERVTITKNGKPAAVLISAETSTRSRRRLFWAGQERVDVEGPTVGLEVVMSDVHTRQDRD